MGIIIFFYCSLPKLLKSINSLVLFGEVISNSDCVKITALVVGLAIAGFIGILMAVYLLKQNNEAPPPPEAPLQVSLVPELKPVLTEIKEEIEVEKPEGFVFDMGVTVTDQITELYSPEAHKIPWTSFDMDNAGPSPVYFCVNAWTDPQTPLPAGQSIHIDLKKRGAINKVYLKCAPGGSSTVSLFIVK